MQHHAFTVRYSKRVRVLSSKIKVFLPTPEEVSTQKLKTKEYLAIWDTGATHSAITKRVVDDLKLESTGIRETRHAGGKSLSNTYLINIVLPNNVTIAHVRVTEVQLIPDDNLSDNEQPQLLIGMDIINLGDFAITNGNNKTTFSFRTPSVQEIDFIPDSQEHNIIEGGNRAQRRAWQAKKRKGQI